MNLKETAKLKQCFKVCFINHKKISYKMKIEFDPAKNQRNITERGINFELAIDFNLATARIWTDTRYDYGEARFIALGYIGDRLHSMVFTVRCDILRVISLRKANNREVKRYEQQA
jgi:uncharacterized protein